MTHMLIRAYFPISVPSMCVCVPACGDTPVYACVEHKLSAKDLWNRGSVLYISSKGVFPMIPASQ